jgi:hypothetical protein
MAVLMIKVLDHLSEPGKIADLFYENLDFFPNEISE